MVIAGFQVYWLAENYRKEKHDLEFRTNVTFNETLRKLQAKKLKLDKYFKDSAGNIKIEVMDDGLPMRRTWQRDEDVAGLVNDITIRVKDSLMKKGVVVSSGKEMVLSEKEINPTGDPAGKTSLKKTGMVISMTKTGNDILRDTSDEFRFEHKSHPGEIFRFLYGVDSLQDSLRIGEIDTAYRAALDKEGIGVPFSVSRKEGAITVEKKLMEKEGMPNKVTLGFSNPVTYEMNLGNSFPYIVKKLLSPILFSLFLIGVTILSFVLLYRNLQRQKKLTEIKNEFISNITHELKTPIATVGVAIEALRNFNAINDPQRTKEYLDISQNELHRLSLLVDKVLKLSIFEKKEIELKLESMNLKDVVDEVVASMKLQIEKHHASVTVNTEGDTSMQGDRLHLLSVIFNLLDNALKYGNGNTAVKFDLKEKGKDVELSVADNGIGISPEFKDKVFEKFFRVPSGNKHNTKGYGLGLSYVSHVIQKHKGTIEVDSQPGIGTKFIITLPKQS